MERRLGPLLCILLVGALVFALPAPASAQNGSGVGVSPATLELDDPPLLRGGGKMATLKFQQHDHDQAQVRLSVQPRQEGSEGDATSWITLSTREGSCGSSCEITVPRTDDFPVQVEVAVPETAANGIYTARVHFRLTQACEADGGACVGVQASTTSTVWIEVQDAGEVKRIAVAHSARVHDMETGGTFQFSVPLENTGNVDANPHIHLEVLDKQQENVVFEHWERSTLLRPGEQGEYTFTVDELDLDTDQYWARVTVYLDDEVIDETVRTFDIVPPGTLKQEAVLRTIRIDGDITTAKVGELVRLEAVVENTGKVVVVATFKGSVLVDGNLVDTLESDPQEIPIGATDAIEMFYRIGHEGQHVIEGRIHYGNKITEERSLLVAGVDAEFSVPGWAWFALGALAPVGLVGMYLLGRRGRSGKTQDGPRKRQGGKRPPGHAASRRFARAPAKKTPQAPAKGAKPGRPGTKGPGRAPPRRAPSRGGAAGPPTRGPPKRRP